MNDEEKFAAQGRAHADLKKYRSDAATADLVLQGYNKQLTGIAKRVDEILKEPLREELGSSASSALKLALDLRQDFPELLSRIAECADDVYESHLAAKQLDDKIKEF